MRKSIAAKLIFFLLQLFTWHAWLFFILPAVTDKLVVTFITVYGVCTYVCVHVCVCICLFVAVCVCMYVCTLCVRVSVCLFVCRCLCMYVCTYMHKHTQSTYTCTEMYVHTHTQTDTHTCLCISYCTSLSLRAFTDNVFSQALYFFKSLYLILSAQQCVSGYPKRVLGYFIAKQYNIMSRVIFTM